MELKIIMECEDEESKLVGNDSQRSSKSSKSSRANETKVHPIGKTQTPVEDDEQEVNPEVEALQNILGAGLLKQMSSRKSQNPSQRLLKGGMGSGSLFDEKTQIRNSELARLDNEFSKDFTFENQDQS